MTEKGTRTTWDGKPISPDSPFEAVIIVRRQTTDGCEYLLLHRQSAEDRGDWAWTPPSGARLPSETIDQCAARELGEETGLATEPQATNCGTAGWPVYLVTVVGDVRITLSPEHDRFVWATAEEAVTLYRPEQVSAPFRRIANI